MEAVLNKENIDKAHSIGYGHDFNCWGATLFALNKADEPFWASARGMKDFLKDETEKVTNNIKEGDILVLWATSDKESLIHTAVYMGAGMYWHKKGSNESEFTNINCIKKTYSESHYSEFRRMKKEN